MALQSLVEHLVAHSLRTDGPFRLRSGSLSDWYLDARQTTFDGEGAWRVGRAVLDVLDESVVAIGGMTMGADPIALATAMAATSEGRTLRAFSIRKEDKDHGAGGRMVGASRPGDRVALVEDTTTTGSAMVEAASEATRAGLQVVQALALVDRSGGKAESAFAEMGIPFRALLRPTDLGVTD